MRYFVWEPDEKVERELFVVNKLVECRGEMIIVIELIVNDTDVISDLWTTIQGEQCDHTRMMASNLSKLPWTSSIPFVTNSWTLSNCCLSILRRETKMIDWNCETRRMKPSFACVLLILLMLSFLVGMRLMCDFQWLVSLILVSQRFWTSSMFCARISHSRKSFW